MGWGEDTGRSLMTPKHVAFPQYPSAPHQYSCPLPSRTSPHQKNWLRAFFEHVERFAEHSGSGSQSQELKQSRHRQIVEPPCRALYRHDWERAYILHFMRSERWFCKSHLSLGTKQAKT